MNKKLFLILLCMSLLAGAIPLALPLSSAAGKAADAGYANDIYEPDTDVNAAPIVMQSATAATKTVAGQAKRPSALIFNVRVQDGVLNAYDGSTKLGTFASVYTANCQKTNVGARVSFGDTATATALANFARERSISNLWVISNDVSMLEIVTDAVPMIRGVVDFTQSKLKAPWQVYYSFDGNYDAKAKTTVSYITYTNGYASLTDEQIYNALFAKGYRTALIPAAEATKEHLEYLAGNHIFTIAQVDKPSETAFYDLIVAGVNGILSTDYATNIAVLEGDLFDASGEDIVIRGGHVMAHRGDTGNATVYPENSLPAILSSAASGATSVEFDIRLTKDKHLVIVHDNTTTGLFRYADDCPLSASEMDTYYTLPINQRNWEGDLEYLVYKNTSVGMCQLYELYEAIDTEYPHLFLATEIKPKETYDYETMNYTIELMDKYNLRHRSFFMAANVTVPTYAAEMGLNCRWLSTPTKDSDNNDVYAVENAYRAMNSGVGWAISTPALMEKLKHFGNIASTPDIFAAGQQMDTYYAQGYYGMATNVTHWSDRYIKALIPSLDSKTGTITAKAQRLTYKHQQKASASGLNKYWIEYGWVTEGDTVDITDFEIIAVAGKPVINQANHTAKGSASDVVALRTKVTLKGTGKGVNKDYTVSYYVYSAPIELSAVNRTALQNAVSNAQKLNKSTYNTDTWASLQHQLTQAQTVLSDATATQSRLTSAKAALQRAVANLVTRADRTKLTAEIRNALTLVQGKYSASTWKSFTTELERAQTVLANKAATQTTLDNAQASLKKAKAALSTNTASDAPSSSTPNNTTVSGNSSPDAQSSTTATSQPDTAPSSDSSPESNNSSQPVNNNSVDDNEQPNASPKLGIIIAIVVVALVAIGGGVTAFFLIRKAKKSNPVD